MHILKCTTLPRIANGPSILSTHLAWHALGTGKARLSCAEPRPAQDAWAGCCQRVPAMAALCRARHVLARHSPLAKSICKGFCNFFFF